MDLRMMLLKERVIKIRNKDEEPFILKSGTESRLFIDIKEASLNPTILKEIVNMIKYIIGADNFNLHYDVFGSIAVGSVPIASVLSFVYGVPQIIVRTDKHDRGTQTNVIGRCEGKVVLLIEDVATTGGSIVKAVTAIREAGGICDDVIVIVDREEGALELCWDNDIILYSVLKKSDFGITEDMDA